MRFSEPDVESGNGLLQDEAFILIKGGTVVNYDYIIRADVLIRDGKIRKIEPDIEQEGAQVINAEGKYVMPGGIDPHTHFHYAKGDDSNADSLFAGTQAAVAGGTTMIIESVMPAANESLVAAVEKWKHWADSKVCCDYSLSVAVKQCSDKTFQEMETLCKNNGINSFLFYMDDSNGPQLTDADIYRCFKRCREIGAVPRVQPANGEIIKLRQQEAVEMGISGPEGYAYARPENLEGETTSKVALLSNLANCPLYVLSIGSRSTTKALTAARKKGYVVAGEVFTTSICFGEENVKNATSRVTYLPLGIDSGTPGFLLNRLASGDLEMTASDHGVSGHIGRFTDTSDNRNTAKGVSSVQERMMIVWEKGVNTAKFDMMRFVAVVSTNAAKAFNIYPRKGCITVGSDADVVVWDPDVTRTITSSTRSQALGGNMSDGHPCKGVPLVTICGGRIVYQNGQIRVQPGTGNFIPLQPAPPFFYSLIQAREKLTPQTKALVRNAEPPDVMVSEQPSADTKFHSHAQTRAGTRDMQDSSFKLSGVQIDDGMTRRGTRVTKPPGGESHPFW